MFEPVIQRMRELGGQGVLLSGNRDEGALLAGVRAAPQPCGRGFLVTRRHGSRLVQAALAADADADEEPNPDDHPSGQYPVIA